MELLYQKLMDTAQGAIASSSFSWTMPSMSRSNWRIAMSSNQALRAAYSLQGAALLRSALVVVLQTVCPGRPWMFYKVCKHLALWWEGGT